jgi:hypothetical protein
VYPNSKGGGGVDAPNFQRLAYSTGEKLSSKVGEGVLLGGPAAPLTPIFGVWRTYLRVFESILSVWPPYTPYMDATPLNNTVVHTGFVINMWASLMCYIIYSAIGTLGTLLWDLTTAFLLTEQELWVTPTHEPTSLLRKHRIGVIKQWAVLTRIRGDNLWNSNLVLHTS